MSGAHKQLCAFRGQVATRSSDAGDSLELSAATRMDTERKEAAHQELRSEASGPIQACIEPLSTAVRSDKERAGIRHARKSRHPMGAGINTLLRPIVGSRNLERVSAPSI